MQYGSTGWGNRMLIKNGIVVNADGRAQADVRIENGKVVTVATDLQPYGAEEIMDVKGAFILPGGVDVHTHIDMPAGECTTSDDYLSGTKAAVMGGTTTVMDFPEYDEGETLQDGLNCWHKKSGGRAFCDYGFHMTVSGWEEGTKEELARMKEQGITSFKAYTAYQDGIGVYDEQLFLILQEMKKLGTLLCVHCENGDVLRCLQRQLKEKDASDIRNHPKSRPNLTEKEAVSRVIDLAVMADVPVYIVHVSTREAAEVIRQAKKNGHKVYAETCPQYLLLDESRYELPGFESAKYVLSPPLRTKADQEALWQAIADGTIDVISTDHCSFRFHGQKDLGREDFTRIPNGIPGIETRMELMLEYGTRRGLSLEKLTALLSSEPARIFGMYPEKGTVKEGSDADLIIVREGLAHRITGETLSQDVDYTPYEGFEVTYQIQDVFVKGIQAKKEGKWVMERQEGRFLKTKLS